MFSVDLHSHTRFFHGFSGRPTAFDPVGAQLLSVCGRWRQLDGIAVTNHDYYTAFNPMGSSPVLIPGVEVTTTNGHVLIVGPDPPARTEPGARTPAEVVALAHEADCVAIIAHPYRQSGVSEPTADFDAVEINGKHPHHLRYVQELAESLDIPVVGGSDAHFPFEVGRAFTEIEAEVLSPASVVRAIRDKCVEPRVLEDFTNRVVQKGYRFVHQVKQWRTSTVGSA